MWMMGYKDGGDFNSIQDSFNGRKFRHLTPRPATAAAASTNPPCLSRIHGTDLLSLSHHFAMVEQNKRDISRQQVVVSSRWNPTPEQLQALEELYRRGTRTPSADQIQQITAQLRRYGKIEGKNVFYWFQNHKARERQKRRRQLESPSHAIHAQILQNKESSPGANRTVFEVEQSKNWASPTNSSTIIAEKIVTAQGATKAGDAECKADGWLQFDDEAESMQHIRNATWQTMGLSCSAAPVTATVPSTVTTVEPNLTIKTQDFVDIFMKPCNAHDRSAGRGSGGGGGGGGGEAQTLQLFPIGNGDSHRPNEGGDDEEAESAAVNCRSNVTPCQFFEFLPLKN